MAHMLGQLSPEEIEELLRSEFVGRLGCDDEGRMYIVPIAYVYDDGAIVGHSTEGRKVRAMRENPNVCFEVDKIDDLSNWRSVIAWGRFEELRGAEADRALVHLLVRLAPRTATPASSQTPKDLTHQHRAQVENLPTVIYRIRLLEKTGRFEKRS